MRLVIQRVRECSVKTAKDNKTVGTIGEGLFVLIGIRKGDTVEMARGYAHKIANLRVFSDKAGKMQHDAKSVNKQILVVSQFTLNADTTRGARPSFVSAEEPKKAERIYLEFISTLKSFGLDVQTGRFGQYMNISVNLDGPVTIIFES